MRRDMDAGVCRNVITPVHWTTIARSSVRRRSVIIALLRAAAAG